MELTVLQAAPPGIGPEEVADSWAFVARAAWFLAGALATVAVGWYLLEPALSRVVRHRNRNNPTIQEAISRYVRLLVVLVALAVGAAAGGYGTILTDSALIVAAGTLAVGVAGQEVIGSLVSGLALVTDPQFNVGDYIAWTDGEGTVQSITLRVTRVRTNDGELLTIPNTVLTSQPIVRPYRPGRYRVVEHLGVAYEDDVDAALDHLAAAARSVEAVLAEPPPEAYVDEFGSDAVVLRVHYWIEDPRRRDIFAVRSAFARAAKKRLEEDGVTISPASKRDLLGRIEVDESA
jgi:small conductance mechanosensitive channel